MRYRERPAVLHGGLQEGDIMINAFRMYLITNAHMVPVEQRHTLHVQLKATTFCFGFFRTPEATVIALVATEQTMIHLREQFRVLEFEMGLTEQDYLVERYQPDEIIPLKRES
jgi:hypothetical protein